jgi:hypothetical protein
MNDEQPKQDAPRLEKLLRRWGVEEAARQTRVADVPLTRGEPTAAPSAPSPSPARAARSAPRPASSAPAASSWRWLPLAASLVLVLGVLALWRFQPDLLAPPDHRAPPMAHQPVVPPPPDPVPSVSEAELAELKTQTAALRDKVQALSDQLANANRRGEGLASELEAARQDTLKVREAFGRRETRLLAEMEKLKAAPAVSPDALAKVQRELQTAKANLAALSERQAARDAELKAARQALAERDQTLKQAQTALAKAVAEGGGRQEALEKQVAQLQADLAAVRADRTQAEAELARTREALATARSKQTDAGEMLGDLYLAAAAPGQTGWAARKTAANARSLLQRHLALAKTLRTSEAKTLFESLDMVLTQLDLLDPADAGAVASFREVLQRARIAERIAAVRRAGAESRSVQQWLLEAQLVLLETPK